MGISIKEVLDQAHDRYNDPAFIKSDPIGIPHGFDKKQDIEIAGFWAAILSWGLRKTIIAKARELMALMGNEPYEFILHHKPIDRKPFLEFKHRTFQPIDTLYFLEFFKWYYQRHESLEEAFSVHLKPDHTHVGPALEGFHKLFFSLPDAPTRTKKHVPSPAMKSTCKRLNMFLRWMVRDDGRGVDFGLWKSIQPAQLVIPLDVHVERIARAMGLLSRKQRDWRAALELTEALKQFDEKDPTRYDFALFGIGVLDKHDFNLQEKARGMNIR